MSHPERYQPSKEEIQRAGAMMTPTQAESSKGNRPEDRVDWQAEHLMNRYATMKEELGISGDVALDEDRVIRGTVNGHSIELTADGRGTIDDVNISERQSLTAGSSGMKEPDPEGQALARNLYEKYKALAYLHGDAKIMQEQDREMIAKVKSEVAEEAEEFQRTRAAKDVARKLLDK